MSNQSIYINGRVFIELYIYLVDSGLSPLMRYHIFIVLVYTRGVKFRTGEEKKSNKKKIVIGHY